MATLSVAWFSIVCSGGGVNPSALSNSANAQGIFRQMQSVQSGRFIEAPRATEQQLREARQAIEEQRYSDAVVRLGNLLAGDADRDRDSDLSGQDFFLNLDEVTEGRPVSESLLGTARRMIGELPTAALETYELRYGAIAGKLLDQAAQTRDWDGVRTVRRKYFHTRAGYEASLLLAQYEIYAGHPLAASLLLDEVVATDRAVGQLGAGVIVMHAAACRMANRPSPSETEDNSGASSGSRLKDVAGRDVAINGEGVTVPTGDDQNAWLDQLAGRRDAFSPPESKDYAMFGSKPDRNGESAGQMPLTNLRWMLSTTSSARQERSIRAVAEELNTTGKLPPPSWVPLRVGDQLLMRTTERLVGVDYRTGKRVWTYPWQSAYEAIDDEELSFDDFDDEEGPGDLLSQRVWNDVPYGQITSDGTRVFMLDDLGEVEMVSRNAMIAMRGVRPADTSRNTLVALEMATEGKLLWRLGAADDGVSTLSDAFFLGPPLPIDGRLYVIVEIAGDINLCCLDPVNGQELWRQHLVAVESGGIDGDPIRRVAGAMPTYHEGVLICPTGAGATVAVDLADRTLRWGTTYARNNERNRNITGRGRGIDASELMQRWDNGIAVAQGQSVLITPIESDRLIGLNLLTGESLFAEKNRVQMRYLAGIRGDRFFVVGGNQVRAYELDSGDSIWTTPRDMLAAGQQIAGRGVFGDDTYLIPTTSNQLIQISLDDGKVLDQRSTRYPLGNLVAVDGEVIVQGPTSLAVAFGEKSLEPIVNRMLEKDPNDFEALVRKSELMIQRGERSDALELLSRARDMQPDNDEVHLLSVSAMLGMLRENQDIDESLVETLDRLIDRPSQRVELLSLRINAAIANQQYVAATERLLDFSSLLIAEPTLESVASDVINDQARQCTLDRWLAARVEQIASEADESNLEKINATVLDASTRHVDGSTNLLQRFADHFRSLDGSKRVVGELIRRYRQDGQWLRCERLILGTRLPNREDLETMDADALEDLASIYVEGGMEENARLVQAVLSSKPEQEDGVDLLSADWPDELNLKWDSLQTRMGFVGSSQRVAKTTLLAGRTFADWDLIADSSNPMALRDPAGGKRMIPMEGLRQGEDVDKEAQLCGGAMVVLLPTGLACVDLYHLLAGDGEAVLWQRSLSGDGGPVAKRRSFVTPFGDQVVRYYISASTSSGVIPEFRLGPVLGDRVLILQGGDLMAIDLITKQTMWRNSTAPQSGAVVSDGQHVAVVSPSTNQCVSFDLSDGRKLETQPWPHGDIWESVGRHVLCYQQLASGDEYEIKLVDPLSGEVKLQTTSHAANRGNAMVKSGYGRVVDGRYLAMMQSDGRTVVWDLVTGREIGTPELPEFEDLHTLHVIKLRGQLIFLPKRLIQRPRQPQTEQLQTADGSFHQAAHGAFAVSLEDGSLRWGKTFEKAWGCTLTQPAETPILIFTRSPFTFSVQSRKKYLDVLALDVRDGEVRSETTGREIQSNNNDLECRMTIQAGLSRVICQIGPELLTFSFGTPKVDAAAEEEFGIEILFD